MTTIFRATDQYFIKARIQRLFKSLPKEKQKPPRGSGKHTISKRYIWEHVDKVTSGARIG